MSRRRTCSACGSLIPPGVYGLELAITAGLGSERQNRAWLCMPCGDQTLATLQALARRRTILSQPNVILTPVPPSAPAGLPPGPPESKPC